LGPGDQSEGVQHHPMVICKQNPVSPRFRAYLNRQITHVTP
jgi:hypothetical protein